MREYIKYIILFFLNLHTFSVLGFMLAVQANMFVKDIKYIARTELLSKIFQSRFVLYC